MSITLRTVMRRDDGVRSIEGDWTDLGDEFQTRSDGTLLALVPVRSDRPRLKRESTYVWARVPQAGEGAPVKVRLVLLPLRERLGIIRTAPSTPYLHLSKNPLVAKTFAHQNVVFLNNDTGRAIWAHHRAPGDTFVPSPLLGEFERGVRRDPGERAEKVLASLFLPEGPRLRHHQTAPGKVMVPARSSVTLAVTFSGTPTWYRVRDWSNPSRPVDREVLMVEDLLAGGTLVPGLVGKPWDGRIPL